jgi:Fe-S-cluster containining protein
MVATDPLAELDRQMQRGSFFTQAVLQRTSQRVSETEVILARVIDQLAGHGLVDPEALGLVADEPETDAEEVDPARPARTTVSWPVVAIREDPPTEPAATTVVDCEARMPVCKAVCCRLKFPLSAPEIEEGSVRWDLGHPYLIRHESDGYCTHLDRGTHACGVYDRRPSVCRTYSCAGDGRIWSDYDAMVLNLAWIEEHLAAPDGMCFEDVRPDAVPVELVRKPA